MNYMEYLERSIDEYLLAEDSLPFSLGMLPDYDQITICRLFLAENTDLFARFIAASYFDEAFCDYLHDKGESMGDDDINKQRAARHKCDFVDLMFDDLVNYLSENHVDNDMWLINSNRGTEFYKKRFCVERAPIKKAKAVVINIDRAQ